MAMIKTDKARQALRNRASLSVQERQILILCDGIRSRQEIAGWLGDNALALMDSLLAQGYLAQRPVEGQAWTVRDSHDALRMASLAPSPVAEQEQRESTLMPVGIDLQPSRPAPLAPAREALSSSAAKRSLAACKMYASGILQMQRGGDAQHMLAQLNASQNENDLVENLLKVLQFLKQKTNASYADNVKKHMSNILPEQHLQALQDSMLSRL
jgi:hypothetical protein